MKHFILILSLFTISLQSILFAQYNNANLKVELDFNTISALTYKNLRLYPVRANQTFVAGFSGLGQYTNLKDAIEKNKIVVSEVNQSGSVNTLYAENVSQDTIFLMAGEIVKGGKQDRVIAENKIIVPGEKVNLSAFCVEQGRWSAGNSSGSFDGYAKVSSSDVRKTVIKDKNQYAVWGKVAEVTKENKAETSTGTYTALNDSKEYNEKIEQYLNQFKNKFDNENDVIGVIVVSGDKIIGSDLFATHDMFINAYGNLLYSYITEAITNGSEVNINSKTVEDYVTVLLDENNKQDDFIGLKGMDFKFRNKKLHLSTFE
jgi:ARG/rhodanese/phosphatase superfamily protein